MKQQSAIRGIEHNLTRDARVETLGFNAIDVIDHGEAWDALGAGPEIGSLPALCPGVRPQESNGGCDAVFAQGHQARQFVKTRTGTRAARVNEHH